MAVEWTAVIIKQEGVRRGIEDRVALELEALGLRLVICSSKVRIPDRDGQLLYSGLAGRPWRIKAICAIISAPVICMIFEEEDAIQTVRSWLGPTNVDKAFADEGCFRGRMLRQFGFMKEPYRSAGNYVHASGNLDEARTDIDVCLKYCKVQCIVWLAR